MFFALSNEELKFIDGHYAVWPLLTFIITVSTGFTFNFFFFLLGGVKITRWIYFRILFYCYSFDWFFLVETGLFLLELDFCIFLLDFWFMFCFWLCWFSRGLGVIVREGLGSQGCLKQFLDGGDGLFLLVGWFLWLQEEF